MKKIIAFLMLSLMILSLCSCGEKTTVSDHSGASSEIQSSEVQSKELNSSEIEEPEEPEGLVGDGNSVVVAMKSSNIKINKIEDLERYTVAYIIDTDGKKYADFYSFKDTGMYNASNDLHSGLMGGQYDLGIVKKENAEGFADWETVWDFSTVN